MRPAKYVNPLAFDYDLFQRCTEITKAGDYSDYEDIFRVFKMYLKQKIKDDGQYKWWLPGVGMLYQKYNHVKENFDPYHAKSATTYQKRYENMLVDMYHKGEREWIQNPAKLGDRVELAKKRMGWDINQIQEFQDEQFDR